MDLGLEGQVAIVTGASRGLGAAAVRALVAEGVRVVAAARSVDDLEALAAEAPSQIRAAPCDMTDLDVVAGLVDVALDAFGGLDVVVNNAGIAPAGPFEDQPPEEWERVLRVNVTAPATLCRAAGRVMLAQGRGRILNIASTSGLRGKPQLVSYSASKGALLRLTEALAAEWAGRGVGVVAIAPGAFATRAQAAVLDDPEVLRRRLRKIPAGRMGDDDDFGPLVCYLASPLASFVTGATFVIDGGEVHKL
ncbi:SDR family NAD(P)-dependent oxidoreductase [Euzebya sp.]|uniref:SDR family NAD(P)-dependent oxidoreductase n=1 Tax=Euzebya sp. TaxID=1971409 RepID=UPI003514A5C3